MKKVCFPILFSTHLLFSSMTYALDTDLYISASGGDARYSNSVFISGESYKSGQNSSAYSISTGVIIDKKFLAELVYSNFDTRSSETISGKSYRIDIDTYAIYAGFKTSRPVYFVTKVGYVYGESSITDPFVSSPEQRLSGLTFSVGTGIKIGSVDLIIEETSFKSSIHFTSIKVSYQF